MSENIFIFSSHLRYSSRQNHFSLITKGIIFQHSMLLLKNCFANLFLILLLSKPIFLPGIFRIFSNKWYSTILQGRSQGQAIFKFLPHSPSWAALKTCISLSQRCSFFFPLSLQLAQINLSSLNFSFFLLPPQNGKLHPLLSAAFQYSIIFLISCILFSASVTIIFNNGSGLMQYRLQSFYILIISISSEASYSQSVYKLFHSYL